MKKEDKSLLVKELAKNIAAYNHFYVVDAGELDSSKTSDLRRLCFNKEVKMMMVKNTLLVKALQESEGEYEELYETLKGSTAVFFSNTGNVPAKLIKEFSKVNKKPVLKSAYVEESIYVGENQLDALVSIKSKDELIGDIIALLQSPAKNVISALQSGGSTIHGVLQTLAERE
ncbi:50S ribosomal protein L10 [Saccharicrinis fermentans]|uniref:Large ribosomal subunit protein uL10 n=1 Tax=Saccharicrinis fermentans DSM 9555 = JCM 21142 TaxID=869213 RepID=W7Y692_9BACT|nr:50S ribosomal protein L10 [Saccharicrinis fermentans]GAF03133.1 50S ribosomal protein L10 [Saccharicrinis fermentans DSM 9555 = JCM 21142]